MVNKFAPSAAACEASEYYNALPFEERIKLAPLLEHYRQMGIAEVHDYMLETVSRTERRIKGIREAGDRALASRETNAPKEPS